MYELPLDLIVDDRPNEDSSDLLLLVVRHNSTFHTLYQNALYKHLSLFRECILLFRHTTCIFLRFDT